MTAALLLLLLLGLFVSTAVGQMEQAKRFFEKAKTHTNNWVVLVETSRFWFNYRHPANVLALYRAVKQMGIPDSNIIVMMGDDAACNARNVFAGTVYHSEKREVNVYGDDVEVDYRGYEVTVESLIRLLTGRHSPAVPRNKRLLSNANSNVLVYMTGHGGEEFIKFQDAEEINSQDLADAFEQMYQKKRYHELLFMVDTCQANSLYKRFYSPNILAVGSSEAGENSYSHHADRETGVSVVDRFTYYLLEYFEEQKRLTGSVNGTLEDLSRVFKPSLLKSHSRWRTDLFPRPLSEVKITDFFGAKFTLDTNDEETNVLMDDEIVMMSGDHDSDQNKQDKKIASIAVDQRSRSLLDLSSDYRVVDVRLMGIVIALVAIFGVFSK